MAHVRIRQAPSGENYGKAVDLTQFENNPPEGLIVHAAGEVDGKFQVIDIWESAEAADKFEREVHAPKAAQAFGANYKAPEPKTYETRNVVRG
jgi:hypothetical protein